MVNINAPAEKEVVEGGLLDAEADLDDAYTAARANRADVKTEQIEWMKTYGQNCGVPFRGRPTDAQIYNARGCILAAMRQRISQLRRD